MTKFEALKAYKTAKQKENETEKEFILRKDILLKESRQELAENQGFKTYPDYLKTIQKTVTNKECALFLGCQVAERILGHIFKKVEKLPYNNPGYDFICGQGYKIDVKASCLILSSNKTKWRFTINKNKTADYFLFMAFDNRDKLNPLHIWLLKSNEIIKEKEVKNYLIIDIKNNQSDIDYFLKYEQKEKLDKVIICCDNIKNKTQCSV